MVKIYVGIKKLHLLGVSSELYIPPQKCLCACVGGGGVDVSEGEVGIYGKGER